MRDTVLQRKDPQLTRLVVSRLKPLVLAGQDKTEKGRHIRKAAMELIKTLRMFDLTGDFHGEDLKEADLVEVDLSRTKMNGLNLGTAFLLSSEFRGSNLAGVDLSNASIRNGKWDSADLQGALLDNCDWFNAGGFTESMLRAVASDHLMSCPVDESHAHSVAAFEAEYGREYQFSLDQIGEDREEMAGFWAVYSKRGGLCESATGGWRRKPTQGGSMNL